MENILDNYEAGFSSEALFLYEATKRGFNISMPFKGDSVYDAILDNGKHLYRIQCKSVTYYEQSRNRYKVVISRGSAKKIRYKIDEVDFFVIYIIPTKSWYIIPRPFTTGKTATFYPHKPESRGKYEKYLGRWDLFD